MKDVSSWNKLLRTYMKKSQWQRCVALLQRMQSDMITPDIVSINSTLSACERSAEWQRVLHFFAQERHHDIDKFTLSILMKVYGRSHWTHALELLRGDLSNDQVLWNTAMAACDKASPWHGCLHLLFSSPSPDLIAHNTLLSSLARATRWRHCLQLLQQMTKVDIISYNSCITACSGALWPWALQLLMEAPRAKLKLSTISFNATIFACDKGHQWQMALHVFELLSASRCRATEVTYNSLLSACEVGLPWSSLLHLLSQAQRHLPSLGSDSWSALAVACGKTTAWTLALSVLQAFGQDAAPLALRQATAKACAAAWRWQDALHLLGDRQLLKLGATPSPRSQAELSREHMELLRQCQSRDDVDETPRAELVRLALVTLRLQ